MCGVWGVVCGVWGVGCDVVCGVRCVVYGVWCGMCGVWCVGWCVVYRIGLFLVLSQSQSRSGETVKQRVEGEPLGLGSSRYKSSLTSLPYRHEIVAFWVVSCRISR